MFDCRNERPRLSIVAHIGFVLRRYRRYVQQRPVDAVGTDHRSAVKGPQKPFVAPRRVRIVGIVDRVLDGIFRPLHRGFEGHEIVFSRALKIPLPQHRLGPLHAVLAGGVGHAACTGHVGGGDHPQLEYLLFLIPSRHRAGLKRRFPREIRVDDRSFLGRLVHRAFEIIDLQDADIVKEKLPLAPTVR